MSFDAETIKRKTQEAQARLERERQEAEAKRIAEEAARIAHKIAEEPGRIQKAFLKCQEEIQREAERGNTFCDVERVFGEQRGIFRTVAKFIKEDNHAINSNPMLFSEAEKLQVVRLLENLDFNLRPLA